MVIKHYTHDTQAVYFYIQVCDVCGRSAKVFRNLRQDVVAGAEQSSSCEGQISVYVVCIRRKERKKERLGRSAISNTALSINK